MRRLLFLLVFVFGFVLTSSSQLIGDQLLDEALQCIGRNRSELGIRPKESWSRFPHEVMFKPVYFDSLYANPLQLGDYTTQLNNRLKCKPDDRGTNRSASVLRSLLSATFYTLLSDSIGASQQMRSSSANLFREIKKIDRLGNDRLISSEKLRNDLSNLPQWLHVPLAKLLCEFRRSIKYNRLSTNGIPKDVKNELFDFTGIQTLYDSDSLHSLAIEKAAKKFNPYFVCKSAVCMVDACSLFIQTVDSLSALHSFSQAFHVEIQTSLGTIIISDRSDRQYDLVNPLLVIDIGGNDTYRGTFAATSPTTPVAALIDFDGNDRYLSSEAGLSQGVGVLGASLLADLHGDDNYLAKNYAQGFGLFGVGILYDAGGTDSCVMQNSGQGCAYFGAGICAGGAGNDYYYIYGDGQGMGGSSALGLMVDYSGNDVFVAESNPAKSPGRADYHSDGKVNFCFAQGAGQGRREVPGCKLSWAGGTGALVDFEGNDTYKAGNFSQASGYWFGTGVLFDAQGNDLFESCYFSQASAAHFAQAVLVDDSGDDRYFLDKTSGAALSFGWDFSNALFVDGKGNDRYRLKMFGIANSMVRSNTFFIEMEGNDYYDVGEIDGFFGRCDLLETYKNKTDATAQYESAQHAIFIDAGGEDVYLLNPKDGQFRVKNNTRWPQPDSLGLYNNYFIGIDSEGKVEKEQKLKTEGIFKSN